MVDPRVHFSCINCEASTSDQPRHRPEFLAPPRGAAAFLRGIFWGQPADLWGIQPLFAGFPFLRFAAAFSFYLFSSESNYLFLVAQPESHVICCFRPCPLLQDVCRMFSRLAPVARSESHFDDRPAPPLYAVDPLLRRCRRPQEAFH